MQTRLGVDIRILCCTLVLVVMSLVAGVHTLNAAPSAQIRAEHPDLFDQETGYRISRHRAPTPDDIPGQIRIVTADDTAELMNKGAVAIDVFGALQSRYDELDGAWLIGNPRQSIPGAVWLPQTGLGALPDDLDVYLTSNLERLTDNDKGKAIIVFCVADCWMSWNAAQRIAAYGYTSVHWFPLGTDGWLDSGRSLTAIEPVPVDVE